MGTAKYYCSTSDVYRHAGIGSNVVSTSNVIEYIQEAEADVDAITQTTYWQLAHSSTSVTGTTASLDTTGLTADEHIGNVIKVTSGSSTEYRIVTDNTSTTVSVDRDWTTVPNSTTSYQIFHCGTPPYTHATTDGDGQVTMYTDDFPLVNLESMTIAATTVTPSYVYQYKDEGQLTLKSSAEYTNFDASNRQSVNIKYWFGVKDEYKNTVPFLVRKYVAIVAALMALIYQIGGTYDDVTVFALGPMSGSLGEPYTNIREAVLKLTLERDRIQKKLIIYNHLY